MTTIVLLTRDDWCVIAVPGELASSGRKVPTSDDYTGAAQGLVRLQKVYNLNIDDIISGNVSSNGDTCTMFSHIHTHPP